MLRNILAGLLAVAALGGCANLTSIHRVDAIGSRPNQAEAIFIDAKQRAILTSRQMIPDPNGGPPIDQLQFCAEAPPDAFVAMSVGGSGNLGYSGSANPNVQAGGALAISESGASFERTQTVNLLRESMYRTCERFISGAISKDEFIIQAARDQRAMVAILAIEQLTGVMRPPSTVITGGSASAVNSNPAAVLAAVQSAADDKSAKDAAVIRAQQAYTTASATVTCDPAPSPMPAPADPTYAAVQACLAANTTLQQAQAAAATSAQNLTWIQGVAANQTFNMTAGSGGGAQISGGGYSQQASANTTAAVAGEVRLIVEKALDFPEVEMMCMVQLRKDKPDAALTAMCLEFVKASVQAETDRLKAESAGYRRFGATVTSDSDRLRAYLAAGPDTPAANWQALLAKSGILQNLGPRAQKAYAAPTTLSGIVSFFEGLAADQRSDLLGVIG
ncbi:MAG: hypothetical protein JWR84_3773 [Caulobacter sp.]|nr:hypothetical protein [Caulobacter sp.]